MIQSTPGRESFVLMGCLYHQPLKPLPTPPSGEWVSWGLFSVIASRGLALMMGVEASSEWEHCPGGANLVENFVLRS